MSGIVHKRQIMTTITKIILIVTLTFYGGTQVIAQPLCKKEGQTLRSFLTSVQPDRPIIMAHRMAPSAGFAENSITTLKHNIECFPCAIQEIDVRITKDGKAVLSHDDSIDRTTNGKGLIKDYTYEQLQKFNLRDIKGNILSDEHIPLLSEALKIMKEHCVAMLDMKPGTDYETMMKVVREYDMMNDVIVICYSLDDAKTIHKQHPSLMLAVGFNSIDGIKKVQQSGLPPSQLVALVPKDIKEDSYYDMITSMGVPISFSAQNNTDLRPDAKDIYKKICSKGISIICTDSISNVYDAFQ